MTRWERPTYDRFASSMPASQVIVVSLMLIRPRRIAEVWWVSAGQGGDVSFFLVA